MYLALASKYAQHSTGPKVAVAAAWRHGGVDAYNSRSDWLKEMSTNIGLGLGLGLMSVVCSMHLMSVRPRCAYGISKIR